MKNKVFIYPSNNKENQYINIQEKAIIKAGKEVTYSLKDFFSTEFFLLNWFETLGENFKIDFIKKITKIFLMKIFNKKILWVVHNKKPHIKYNNDKSIYLSYKLMKILLKKSYKIIILCDETQNVLRHLNFNFKSYKEKIYKIPHPNYIGIYPEFKIKKIKQKSNTLKLLYLGQINKYKNIEYLIEIMNSYNNKNITLTIAGNCKDTNYKKELLSMVKNQNIIFDIRFIPDNELINIISKNDLIILPYSLESSLNSGTIFLAFSYKKTVISPLIGTLKDFPNQNCFYSYNYTNNSTHKENLLKTIKKVYKDYKKDKNIIISKGLNAFEMVKKYNNIEVISSLYHDLFFID